MMKEFSIEALLADDNPVIHSAGKATFGRNKYCRWCTSNGSSSVCSLSNGSVADTLSVVVSGAPETLCTTSGAKLNGLHYLPPNQPDGRVLAIGDFLGQQVSIVNVSTSKALCLVETFLPSGGCG